MLKALWQEEKFDIVAFFIIFLIVGFLVFENFSVNIKGAFEGPFQCSQYNNNFEGCVEAQQSGKGCAWWAACAKCIRDGEDVANICNN